jgi:hypothetical protein
VSHFPPHRFYYLDNFECALGWLVHRYGGLLSEEEQTFIRIFGTLPLSARALLVRLIMRRGPLFRVSKIRYEEIGDVGAAIGPPRELGWINVDPVVASDQICSLLTKRTLATHFGLPLSWSKEMLRSQVEAHHPHPAPASQWAVLAADPIIEVKIAALCSRLQLLFFGNWHQEWNEFVLSDLGIFKYEQVIAQDAARAFDSRAHIETFYALFHAREALEQDAPADDVLALLPTETIDHEWLEERRAKLLFAVARREERSGELSRAAELYAQCHYPGANARFVRVLEQQGRLDEARCLIERSAGVALVESESELLDRARRRLAPKSSRSPATRVNIVSIELSLDDWECVEESAAQSLNAPDAPVFFAENLLINGLFGLWCWNIIFEPVPGAFFHPFQRGPADLWSPMFVERRRELFNKAFLRLERDEYAAPILAIYRAKQGTHNPFVFWGGLTESLIELALYCIPALHLRRIFERMLADLERNSSGFPDLVQFYPQERRYRFIEVKGPGDRLQDHQRRWMRYFSEHQIPALVCHVSRERAAA